MVNAVPQLEIGPALQLAFSRITDMNGRSRRSEFWWTMLVVGIASVILSLIPVAGPILSLLLGIATIPLAVRRMHDTGKGPTLIWVFYGIYALAVLLTVISVLVIKSATSFSAFDTAGTLAAIAGFLMVVAGIIGIVLIVFWCQDSQPFPNQWGISPKYPDGQLNSGYQQPPYGQQPQQPYYGQQPQQPNYQQPNYQQPQQPQYPPQQPQYPPQQPQYPPQQPQ